MNSIKENISSLSAKLFPVSPANSRELDANSFMKEVNNLLKMGKRDGWTEDFLTSQILVLTDQNPKLVETMDFPRTPEDINNQLIVPDQTGQNTEHLEFVVSENRLVHYDDQGKEVESWLAVTGNLSGKVTDKNKGPLPPGEYHLEGKTRSKNAENDPKHWKSFCDSNGNCWSQTLKPNFETTRTELAVHPDGGDDGTAGCVGLKGKDSLWVRGSLDQQFSAPVIVKP